MKKGILFFSIITLAYAIAGNPAIAEEKTPPAPTATMEHHPDHEALSQKMDSALGLTPDQKTKMQALRESFTPAQKTMREDLKSKQTALREMLDSAAPDRAKADDLAREINLLQNKMMISHIDHIFKVRAILTPEQYKKLEQERKSHHKEWDGKKRFGDTEKDTEKK